MTKQNKVVLLVDADIVAFRSASAAEKRSIIAVHKSGAEKQFKNRTELKDLLKSKNKLDQLPDYAVTDVQTPEDISHALRLCKVLIKRLQQRTAADVTELYLGSGLVFRNDLALPSHYKQGRSELLKPLHLKATRDYLLKAYNTSLVKQLESDDVLTIRAYEELAKGNIPIIASNDKDALQSQGIRVYNWTKDVIEQPVDTNGSEFDVDQEDQPVSVLQLEPIPSLGRLWKDKAQVKGNGLMFLCFQALSGDPVDGYCGYDLTKRTKYGPTAAMRALSEATTEQQCLDILIKQYQWLYPDMVQYQDCHGVEQVANWRDLLEMYWKCAYMKRSWDDSSYFWDYAKQYDVHHKDYE